MLVRMNGGSGSGHLTAPEVGPYPARRAPDPRPEPHQVSDSAPSSARRDLLVLVVACLWLFDLALRYDLSMSMLDWARRHESSAVGEILVLLVIGFLGLALIAWRRCLHERAEGREHARTQQALMLTAERYHSLFEHHPSAVFSVDVTGRFTATNAACERITGYGPGRLREMTFFDLLARGYVDDTEAAFRRALDREPQRLEVAVLHADGHVVELAVTGLPMVVDDVVVGVYGVAEDISDAKRVRRELVRRRVEAEQAHEAKSLFLANVSHEIRGPLSSLLETAELLRESGLDAGQLRLVESMDHSGARLQALVNQVLEFSRCEIGSSGSNAVPFDVRLLVGEVAALMRPSAERKSLFFKCTVGPGIPELVYGDPAKVTQVLTNLVDNAIEFTEAGWVRLVVSTAHNFGDQVSIRFEVHDSGVDVSKDQERRLHLSFGQAPPASPRTYDDSGLGLAVSQHLVTTMGGAIELSSAPGLGSAFSFSLPFALPADQSAVSGIGA
jgi:PAS domain S-box-containing protein